MQKTNSESTYDVAMSLRIYNTLTRKKELFRPFFKKKVGMYLCGPTVYHDIHVGNVRPMVVFDLVCRYLKHKGYEVIFVRNITDIDDKIIKRAQEEKRDASEVAKTYTRAFEDIMQQLGVSPPDHSPKATEHIPEMIEWTKGLIEKGFAYEAGGEVLFSIEKFKPYGRLSKKKTGDLMAGAHPAGARVEVSERKRNPVDFVLWKPSKPGEPSWESPWGAGRPGWHLECSVMSTKYLGKSFDIHGGGVDLIFPHHENEIAQSKCYLGKPFVKYWMHNGLLVFGREKMSKSLGNVITAADFLKKNQPQILKFILLSNHYRSSLEFSDKTVKDAILALEKIYKTLFELQKRLKKKTISSAKSDSRFQNTVKGFWKKFEQALDDDFNTAKAFGDIFDFIRSINRFLDRNREVSKNDKASIVKCVDIFKKIGDITGLFTEDPEKFLESLRQKRIPETSLSPELSREEIEKWIELRKHAREQKDWKKADEIREHLLKRHIILEDTPSGTNWKREL